MAEPLVRAARARVPGRVHPLGRARDRALPHRPARRPHRGGAARRRPRARAADGVRPDHERARSRADGDALDRGRPARHRADVHVGRGAARPASTRSTKPFAFALIRPDGADTAMLHVVDCGERRRDPRRLARRAALAGRAHRARSPTSRRGFRSATARSPSRRRCTCPAEDEQPVTGITVADPARVRAHRRASRPPRYLEGSRRRKDHRRHARRRATTCTPRRAAPTRSPASRRRSRSRCRTRGVITTFCVVNIPGLSELAPEIPYVSAQILLDGANNTFFGLIRGVEVDDVHMGMRVKAKWADELKPDHTSILWWEPTGEPDEDYEPLQGLPLMRDVAVVSFVCSRDVARDGGHNETEMIVPDAARGDRGVGHPEEGDRVRLLGQPRLPAGRTVRVRVGARRGRRVAADPGEPRRDGRGVGALRSVGRDPDRRGRQRARLRLRQVVARRPARDHDAADRPVLRRCRCGRRWSTWPRCRRARTSTRAAATEERSRRGRGPRAAQRPSRTRTRCARAT